MSTRPARSGQPQEQLIRSEQPSQRRGRRILPGRATDLDPRRSPWFWPLSVAGTYTAGAVLVATAEYLSELAKIGRGTFTDTLMPCLFTNVMTLPMSLVHPALVDHRATFSAATSRHLLQAAMLPTLLNVASEAFAVAVIVLVCTSWSRRRSTPR